MPRTYLGLGGNVGNVAATFADALRALQRDGALQVLRTSSLYRTAAIGENAGDDFLNAVAEIDTSLSPRDLLKLTQSVETAMGRTHAIHWGPRPLDIDILLYGAETVDEPDLAIPHPALWYRRFVLDPLAEIAPDLSYPNLGSSRFQNATIYQLRQRLLIRPFRVCLGCPYITRQNDLVAKLKTEFPTVDIVWAESAKSFLPSTLREAETNLLVAILDSHEAFVWGSPRLKTRINSASSGILNSDEECLTLFTAVVKAATDTPVVVDGPIHC